MSEFSTLFELLESNSEDNEEKQDLILSIKNEVGAEFRNANIHTHEFNLEDVYADSFVFTGFLDRMPNLYTRPMVVVTFKCDDDIVKFGGDGYLSGHYQFQWSMRRWVDGKITPYREEPGKVKMVTLESPYLQLHIRIDNYQVRSVHLNDVHYYVSEDVAKRLLIPSRDIEEWYDRYKNFGPTLDDRKLPPFLVANDIL